MVYASFATLDEKFSARDFLLRRFIRIFPNYWVFCALYLLFYNIWSDGYKISVTEIIGSLLLLPGYSPLIIGPAWTLAYEIYFYLSFALALTLGMPKGLIVLSAFFLLSIIVGIIFHFDTLLLMFWSNPLLIEFLFGTGIAYLVLKRVVVPITLSFGLQLIAVFLFAMAYAIGYGNAPTAITWGGPSALLIAGLVFNESRGVTWSWVRHFAFLGDSSYSLYLIHIMLIDMIVLILRHQLQVKVGGIWLAPLVTVICVFFALLYYELVENRMLTLLRRLLRLSRGQRLRVLGHPGGRFGGVDEVAR
jgi:exopolysaccharide production protein ExoZ